jgi:putative hydroxymethylpyrimidine transport system substrate-binding protein
MKPVIAILVAALLFAGCGEKTEPTGSGPRELQPFTLILDYFPNADHAPIYAALAAGEFEKAGLDVKIQAPPDPSAPLRLLQAKRADLAISYEPEVLLARDKARTTVAVGALVQKPLTTLMAIGGRGVKTVADLRGKTVGTAGIPYQRAYLDTILDRAHVPKSSVKVVDVGFNLVPAMISKKVDATLGAFWNYEGVDLDRRGRKPVILRMEDLGVPTYNELVFAARRASLDTEESSKIRRFLAAVARGAVLVRRDPEAAADALVKANHDLDRPLQLAAIKASADVFLPEDTEKPFGYQDPNAWIAYGRWMVDRGLLKNEPEADGALTNEFLPGEGLQTNREQY